MKRVELVFKRKESEETWEMHNAALRNMTTWILKIDAHKQTYFIERIKKLKAPIIISLLSERSRLSGTAMEMLKALSKAMKTDYQDIHELFATALFSLFSKSSKVTHTRALECYKSIVNNSSIPKGIRHLCLALKKPPIPNKSARECALECLNTLIQVNDPTKITQYILSIEETIKISAKDPSSEVRSKARVCYKAYHDKFTEEAERFISKLPDDVKRYLIPTLSASSSTSMSHSVSSLGRRASNQSIRSVPTKSASIGTRRILGNSTLTSKASKSPVNPIKNEITKETPTKKHKPTSEPLSEEPSKKILVIEPLITDHEAQPTNEDPLSPTPSLRTPTQAPEETFVQSKSENALNELENEESPKVTPSPTLHHKVLNDQVTKLAETQPDKQPEEQPEEQPKKPQLNASPSPTTHRGLKRIANTEADEARSTKRINGRQMKRPVATRLSTARQSAVRSSMSLPDTPQPVRRSPKPTTPPQRLTTYHKLPRVATLGSKSTPLIGRSSTESTNINKSPTQMSPKSVLSRRSSTGLPSTVTSSGSSETAMSSTPNPSSSSPKTLKSSPLIRRKRMIARMDLGQFDINECLSPKTYTTFKKPHCTSGTPIRKKRVKTTQTQDNEPRALRRDVKRS
ncbi:clasp N terminal-domain-containing protein [Phycomyces blakesleeanus]